MLDRLEEIVRAQTLWSRAVVFFGEFLAGAYGSGDVEDHKVCDGELNGCDSTPDVVPRTEFVLCGVVATASQSHAFVRNR